MEKTIARFVDFFFGLLTAGTRDRYEIGERSRIIFLNAVTLAGAVMIAAFAVIGFLSGNTALGTACAAASAVVFANLALIHARKTFAFSGVVDCVVIFVFYLYLVLTGGEAGSGILWSMTYPLITLFLLGSLAGSITALAYGAAMGICVFTPALNAAHFPTLYSVRVVGSYFFIWLFALIYELVKRGAFARLQDTNESLASATASLESEKKQTDDILGGVDEGIFLLDRGMRIGASHSRRLETILGTAELEGRGLLDILSPALAERDRQAATDYLGMLAEGKVNPELLADINPLEELRCAFPRAEGREEERHLRFAFVRINELSAPFPFLGVVADVTEEHALKLRLAVEEREHHREMESLFQIIHVDPTMMREFIADTESELESVNELMRREGASGDDILEALSQSVHAIKGNALLLGLDEFGLKAHDFEDSIRRLGDTGHGWRDLLELTIGLASLRSELDRLEALIGKILSFRDATRESSLGDGGLFQYTMEKLVRRESERTGIPAVLDLRGFGRRQVPAEHRKLVKDILVQFIRNSFAHGFEPAAVRIAGGKGERGAIELAVEWGEGSYTLRYRDDGRGLDPDLIRERARAMPGFAAKVDGLDNRSVLKLIFQSGFSTSADPDPGSGRGVGMPLVRRRVAEAGGSLSLKSSRGRYMECVVTLPLPQAQSIAS